MADGIGGTIYQSLVTMAVVVLFCLCGVAGAAPVGRVISGYVQTSGGAGVGGVEMAGDNGAGSAVTGADGAYSVVVPNNWSGTITVSKAGWLITPGSKVYSKVHADIANENYIAYQPTISGYVRQAGGTGLSEASVSASGVGETTTNVSGYYEIVVPYDWSGILGASLSGYSFASRDYLNVTADQVDQDFTGYQPVISGVITSYGEGLDGVTLTASGGGSAVTDAGGSYDLIVPYGWSGTVTPSKPQYTFTPADRVYSNVTADTGSQDYTGILPPVSISGYVRDSGGTGIIDVNITADNGGGSVLTDTSGYYSIAVPYNWSGTVTAQRVGWQITPPNYIYSNIDSDQTDQDFVASYVGIIVKADGTGDFTTIQAAIDAAVDGDVVIVYPGRYYERIQFSGRDIILRSTDPNIPSVVESTIIDASYSGSVVKFDGTETSNCMLSGFTITHGRSSWGGGICGYDTDAVISSCIIKYNSARYGGGLSFCNGSITNCEIIGNSASSDSDSYGGGLYKCDGPITNCVIKDNLTSSPQNIVSWGGGLYDCDGQMTGCTIENNSSSTSGGGLSHCYGQLTSCTVTGNSAPSSAGAGGGFYQCGGKITDCNISGNTAKYGGGFYQFNGDITNSIIKDNIATDSAGGMLYFDGHMTGCVVSNNSALSQSGGGLYEFNALIENCLIKDNSAARLGGGLKNSKGSVLNCTIIGNTAGISGGGVHYLRGTFRNNILWNNSPDQLYSVLSTPAYCCIEGGYAGQGNISDDPMLSEDSIHLLTPSFCIDAGDPNYVAEPNETDIDGDPRVVGWLDIGADEVYSSTAALIVIIPGILDFEAEGLSSPLLSQNVSIRNYGIATLNWQTEISGDCNWLSVFPETGQVNAGQNSNVEVRVNASKPGYGVHSCQFSVADSNAENSPQVVTVNLEVLRPEISISSSSFDFIANGIDSNTPPQVLTIQNTGYDSLNWQIEMANDCDWLKVSALAGQAGHLETNEVVLGIDHNNISYGIYGCQFSVVDPNAANSPQVVTVNLEVLRPEVGVNNDYFYFSAYGKSDPYVAAQELVISNTGFDMLNWHVEIPNDCNWLSVSPAAGQVTDGNSIVMLTVDPNKAAEYGYNYCTFNIVDSNASNSPVAVTVRLNVYGPSLYVSLRMSRQILKIYAERNTRAENTFEIRNTGYDVLHWQIETPDDCNWLEEVKPLSGECASGQGKTVTVTVDANGLGDDVYQTSLSIYSPECNATFIRVLLVVYIADANEIHVPADYPTIQAAIDAANDWDVVVVSPGTYTGDGNRDIDFKGKMITVRSKNGPESCIIDIGAPMEDWHTGFSFENGEDEASIVDGFTITGGYTYQGGGIRCSNSSPSIKHCIITKNIGGWGGGIALLDSRASIVNCLIFENEAWDCGGGIFAAYGSDVTITNCTITANAAQWVGGILCYYSIANMRNCILWANTSPSDKEFGLNDSQLVVSYSDVLGGQLSGDVDSTSVLSWWPGNIDVDPCFARAGYLDDNGTPADSNDDLWIGGDYHLKSWAGRWEVNEFMSMDAEGDGFLDMRDFAVLSGEWQETSAKQGFPGAPPLYYPYLRADLDNSGVVDVCDLVIFCGGYLGDYNEGRWVYDDVNSACIDAGDPEADWTGELWPHGKRVNMGAYGGTAEASMSLSGVGNIANLDNDPCDVIDLNDLTLLVNKWCYEEHLLAEDLNRDGKVDFGDYAILAMQY